MAAVSFKHHFAARDRQEFPARRRLLPWAIAAVSMLTNSSLLVAHEASDLILRVGAAHVEPDESSSVISTFATGSLAGTAAGVGNNTQLGLNLVYMITDFWAVEVLAASPFEHDLTVSGLGQYDFSTTDLGSTNHLPPTISALYYFGSPQATVKSYVGAGLNYTTFFDETLSTQARNELAASSLDLVVKYRLRNAIGTYLDAPSIDVPYEPNR